MKFRDSLGVSEDVSTANPLPVVLDANEPETVGRSSVPDSASSVSLLAANTARKGATFFNDSGAALFLALGASAASPTSFTVKVPADGYYELPYGFVGAVVGIWASDAGGSVRITELT